MLLVGAVWGCTNPLMRRGSKKGTATIKEALRSFAKFQVFLPFAINQSGSLLYYYTLSQSSLSLAVPICNGLALVFSLVTSAMLGESLDRPFRTILGATLVVFGVGLCLVASEKEGVGG